MKKSLLVQLMVVLGIYSPIQGLAQGKSHNGYANKHLHLCPIRNNWALIGLTDKYLSPAGAEIITVSSKELKIKLAEAGPFSIWSGKGMPKSAGITFASAGNGLYSAKLAVGKGSRIITISR